MKSGRAVASELSFILAKLLRKLQRPALRNCQIDKTARVMAWSQLNDVIMGRYSYCGYDCTMSNVQVGAFCSIAGNVHIGGAEHPTSFVSTSPVFTAGRNSMNAHFAHHDYEPCPRTTIGSDVWIGRGANIKAGVMIGHGAIVGMGSVVTKDIPPYGIWAGNPAREIRKRFSDDQIEKLLKDRWWERSAKDLASIAKKFNDVDDYLREQQ